MVCVLFKIKWATCPHQGHLVPHGPLMMEDFSLTLPPALPGALKPNCSSRWFSCLLIHCLWVPRVAALPPGTRQRCCAGPSTASLLLPGFSSRPQARRGLLPQTTTVTRTRLPALPFPVKSQAERRRKQWILRARQQAGHVVTLRGGNLIRCSQGTPRDVPGCPERAPWSP